MGNILEEIVAHKKVEVQKAKDIISHTQLEKAPLFQRDCISMSKSVANNAKTGIIAEFKRQSPSKGVINGTAKPDEVAQGYHKAGMSGMSVLTDEKYFGGSEKDLRIVREEVAMPLLRKDFIIDEYQILEARAMGADTILLISACLSSKEMRDLGAFAHALNMEVLMEVHNEAELEKALNPYINMLGVNNRDLKRFKTDIETSKILSEKIPAEFIKISESGIHSIDTILDLIDYGYQGFLIGENFMKTENPAEAAIQFANELQTAKAIK